jgi:hypothetical protein
VCNWVITITLLVKPTRLPETQEGFADQKPQSDSCYHEVFAGETPQTRKPLGLAVKPTALPCNPWKLLLTRNPSQTHVTMRFCWRNPPDQETPGFCSTHSVAGATHQTREPLGLLYVAGATHQTRKPLGLLETPRCCQDNWLAKGRATY